MRSVICFVKRRNVTQNWDLSVPVLAPLKFDNAAVVTDAVAMMNYAFTNDVDFETLSLAAQVRNVVGVHDDA
jgi:hypothetical protein